MAETKKKKTTKTAGRKNTKRVDETVKKEKDIVDGLYDYAKMLERSMATQDMFGEGLCCSRTNPSESKSKSPSAKIRVTKGDKLIGVTSAWPIYSYEQGGLFYVDSKDGKGVQYVNGKGERFKRVYGEGSASMSSGFARVEIIDEEIDKTILQTVGKKDARVYTFIKLTSEGKIRTMKARFSQACFIDKCGLGRVVVAGEQRIWAYVDRHGKVLPYRFANAEECFRDGLAQVRLMDGRTAFIGDDGHIYRRNSKGKLIYDKTCEDVSSIHNTEEFRIEENGLVVSLRREKEMLAKENHKRNKKVEVQVEKPLLAENADIEIVTKKSKKDIVLF